VTNGKKIVVGITGASGAVYAQRLIGLLLEAQVEVHLIVSPMGARLLHEELGIDGAKPTELVQRGPGDQAAGELLVHPYRDVGALPASGSFRHDGMVVVPCSANTMSAVATGSAQNLLHRAAHVTLKERRRLVLVHREMPLSLVDIRNLQAATEAGAIVCPASPGFYMHPQRIEDLVDFVVGRILDLLEVEHHLQVRWGRDAGAESGGSDVAT
jgi:4-hydroxy-3-polyprenylbenzoate decarboxylase